MTLDEIIKEINKSEANTIAICENKRLNLYETKIDNRNRYTFASKRKYEDLFKTKVDSVGCFIIIANEGVEKILLKRKYQYPTQTHILDIVHGNTINQESIFQTLYRIFNEETGIDLDKQQGHSIDVVNNAVLNSPTITDETSALIMVKLKNTDVSNFVAARDGEGFELLSREEAINLIRDGVDKQGNPYSLQAWAALMYFISYMWKPQAELKKEIRKKKTRKEDTNELIASELLEMLSKD